MRRVGIDLALRASHQAMVFDDAKPLGRSFQVEQTKGGIDKLERRACAGTEGPCEFIMEPTGLVWMVFVAELVRRGHRTYVPKPQKTSALRKFYSTFAKSDSIDTHVLGLVRHVDPQGVYELQVPTATQTSLAQCVKQRARLVAEAAKSKTRIKAWLVLANPHLCKAFGEEVFSQVGRAFLKRFLNPFKALEMGKSRLKAFWQRHVRGGFDEKRFERVFHACETTCEMYKALLTEGKLPFDYAVFQDLMTGELERIEFLEKQVAKLDKTIAPLYRELDPERTLEREVPGVAGTIAAAIEAIVGDIERFENIKSFASYFGMVPRTHQTGGGDGKSGQRLTKGGSNLLKQYIYLAAATARRHDPEMAATYERAMSRSKHHNNAMIIVAHKLVRKIYALLRLRAEARRARAEGRPAEQVPPVKYRLCHPEEETTMSRKEARNYIEEHFPSKSSRTAAKKTTAQTNSKKKGSPQDAATGAMGAPSGTLVPVNESCGNPVDNLVDNMST